MTMLPVELLEIIDSYGYSRIKKRFVYLTDYNWGSCMCIGKDDAWIYDGTQGCAEQGCGAAGPTWKRVSREWTNYVLAAERWHDGTYYTVIRCLWILSFASMAIAAKAWPLCINAIICLASLMSAPRRRRALSANGETVRSYMIKLLASDVYAIIPFPPVRLVACAYSMITELSHVRQKDRPVICTVVCCVGGIGAMWPWVSFVLCTASAICAHFNLPR